MQGEKTVSKRRLSEIGSNNLHVLGEADESVHCGIKGPGQSPRGERRRSNALAGRREPGTISVRGERTNPDGPGRRLNTEYLRA